MPKPIMKVEKLKMSTENGSFPGNFFKFPSFLNTYPNSQAFTKVCQRNIETLTEINTILYSSFSSIITRQAELMQKETQDIIKIMSTIMSAPNSVENHATLVAETSKDKLDKSLANMREIATDLSQAQEKAASILSTRIREGADEWHSVVKIRQKQVA